MRTILIHSLTGENNQMFNPDERDGYNEPMIYLKKELYHLGYDLRTSDNNDLKNCEWVIFFDESSVKPYSGWRGVAKKLKAIFKGKPLVRDLYDECTKLGMMSKIALFLWEPPSVIVKNWDLENHKLFPKIFTWNDKFIDGQKFVKIHWPQTHKFPKLPEISFREKKLLVNISMNKFSNHPQELYSARRSSIRYFEQNQSENFDLFGIGWNRPANIWEKILPFTCTKYPSYRGTLKNKWDVLPQYRFSLCYENIYNEPGYVTEKIFDSMRAGCVPVYWGAPNISEYVDDGTFVDRRKFSSDNELESYLINMNEAEHTRYIDAIQTYLNGNKFRKFLPESFSDLIIRTLKL
jgi:alpha(1,3/1,4) fucosyltransferase